MAGEAVSPQTTLAVVLGASAFPRKPKLASGPSFLQSASEFRAYLLDEEDGFGLPKDNLFDRFDSEASSTDQLEALEQFLSERRKALDAAGNPARDLIIYYLGHGAFDQGRDYFLAIQKTREGGEGASSIRMRDLAQSIRNEAGGLRRYLILDCCFSGAAYKELMGGPSEAARVQIAEVLPVTGTSLLCSSSSRDVSMAPEGASYTMFSGALLQVLRQGVPRSSKPISLATLGEEVRTVIRRTYEIEAVRPEVLSPDQRDDDLKDVPLFPNAALRRRNFDCAITIVNEEQLTVEFANEKGRLEKKSGQLTRDPFAMLTVQRLSDWVNIGVRLDQEKLWKGSPCEPEDLKVIGFNLYRILFGDPAIRDVFNNLYARFVQAHQAQIEGEGLPLQMRLRLTFNRQADEIARLPWEFLYVPPSDDPTRDGFFLAGERTELVLTRFVPPSPSMRISEPKNEPLSILVAFYSPTDEPGMSSDEKQALLSQLRTVSPKATVVSIENASWRTLRTALETSKPHIFHFVGYGAYDEKRRNGGLALIGHPDDPGGRYYTESEKRSVLPLTGQDLLNLFSYEPKPRVVFLHGCRTAVKNAPEAFSSQEALKSCARELVFARIPAVVAMQFALTHTELATFATATYTELAKGRSLEDAVKSGRVALGSLFLGYWGQPRFGSPLVYMQTNDPLVLALDAAPTGTERAAAPAAGNSPSGNVRPATAAAGGTTSDVATAKTQRPASSVTPSAATPSVAPATSSFTDK
jgi:CHAT domain-containing protein/caspase domain-containing protein